MSLEASLRASARACQGAAIALSHSLRRPAHAPAAPPNLLDTFREAEAFAITVRAVLDEAAPLLPLLAPDSKCVGRQNGLVYPAGRVTNGFDTIAVVLVALLDTAVDAILDVAANQHRWLVSPLQASATFEKMVGHHGQLRAMYGIVHLAAKIVSHADVEKTLFVEVTGDGSRPELEPAKWRAAIKMDDFYGRHFGFHYSPEMRNVLRVVNIARGSVHKSHADHDNGASSLIKNVTMLGWGWVYSNMVLMNNLGLNIDGVSQIGADNAPGGTSIQALRKFMNLVEEPLVAGVSGLTGVDVAVDKVFEIPEPGAEDGSEAADSPLHSEKLRNVLAGVDEPVCARLMSLKHRPIQLPVKRPQRPAVRKQDAAKPEAAGEIEMQNVQKGEEGTRTERGKAGVTMTETAMQMHDLTDGITASSRIQRSVGVIQRPVGVETVIGDSREEEEQNEVVRANMANDMWEESQKMAPSDPNMRGLTAATESLVAPVVDDIDAREEETRIGVSADVMITREPTESSPAMSPSAALEESPSKRKSNPLTGRLAGAAESSYLATTIKTELIKLQSNVSLFLGIEEAKPASGLILHFHGGGFVSQSSGSHANYLKEWCADIPDAVLLSIDYKLAPEHKFPVALHECVYTYVWALQNAERLGTRCDRVVFAGDSAGGNLAVATALLVQELGIRAPDGVCVAYPALYVNVAWSPSRLLSFFDPLLPLSVLELCVKSYLPAGEEQKGQECELISPVVAEPDTLRGLPPITMVCGSLDPLLDDAILFAHRLRKAGREDDVMRVYEAMPHGFLNMQQVNVTARSCMRFMAKTMAEYLNLPLRKGSRAANPDGDDSAASAAVFDP